MSGRGWCADKLIERAIAYLLRCPKSSVPETMWACKFSDKESKNARKQMAVHQADNNATTTNKGGSAKVGGGGGGDSDSNGSGDNGNDGNDSDATARWRRNRDGDGRQ